MSTLLGVAFDKSEGRPTVVLVNAEGISYASILYVAFEKGKDVPPASNSVEIEK